MLAAQELKGAKRVAECESISDETKGLYTTRNESAGCVEYANRQFETKKTDDFPKRKLTTQQEIDDWVKEVLYFSNSNDIPNSRIHACMLSSTFQCSFSSSLNVNSSGPRTASSSFFNFANPSLKLISREGNGSSHFTECNRG